MAVQARTVSRIRRPLSLARRAFPLLIVCAALAVLAACSSGGSTTSGGTPSASATASVKADASLCSIIAPSDFFAAVGGPVGKENSNVSTIRGNQVVDCAYLPSNLPGAGGSISFVFASDATTYYSQFKQEEQDLLNGETDLSGLGDAAYWGTQTNSPDAFELTVRKGNVVVNILMDGAVDDGSVYLNSAKQFASTILTHV